MKHPIGMIAHVGSGTTTLSAAIAVAHASALVTEAKTINQIIEEDKATKLTVPPIIELTAWDFKTGKENRRERRKKQRKNKQR